MALNTLLVGLLACGLVASALAYGELHAWRGLAVIGLYVGAGLMASELIAAPFMWELFGLRSGWVESLSMATALGIGLWRVCKFVSGGESESLRSTE